MEVAEVVGRYPKVLEANVYGIQIPGFDGQAGMVALGVDGGFDISGLYQFCKGKLPSYAIPLFIRIQREM